MTNAALRNQHSTRRRLFTKILLKKETSRMLYLEHSLVWCWKLYTSESKSGTPGKFWSFLEKDGDQLCPSCEI